MSTRRIVLPALLAASLVSAPPALATVEVSVRRADGSPAAGAVVCVGTPSDLAQFDRKPADAQGRVLFPGTPTGSFVVTASLGGRGAQQLRSAAPALGGTNPSLSLVQVTLPAGTGGPACPTGPAGGGLLVPPGVGDRLPVIPTPIRTVGSINVRRENCFGALGMQCGLPQPPMPPSALCAGGSCFINGGSWRHDECCFANPNGMACKNGPLDAVTGHDGRCAADFDKAVRQVSKGIFWKRNVDFGRNNTTGRVEFTLYCAPRDTLLSPEDQLFCCSRSSRPLTAAEGVAAAAAREPLVACR